MNKTKGKQSDDDYFKVEVLSDSIKFYLPSIEVIRKETFKGPFQRFLTIMESIRKKMADI
ncbi:MAG: hypothetical protein ACJ72J_15200 [Nitrososphaeraceae archaeon]